MPEPQLPSKQERFERIRQLSIRLSDDLIAILLVITGLVLDITYGNFLLLFVPLVVYYGCRLVRFGMPILVSMGIAYLRPDFFMAPELVTKIINFRTLLHKELGAPLPSRWRIRRNPLRAFTEGYAFWKATPFGSSSCCNNSNCPHSADPAQECVCCTCGVVCSTCGACHVCHEKITDHKLTGDIGELADTTIGGLAVSIIDLAIRDYLVMNPNPLDLGRFLAQLEEGGIPENLLKLLSLKALMSHMKTISMGGLAIEIDGEVGECKFADGPTPCCFCGIPCETCGGCCAHCTCDEEHTPGQTAGPAYL